MKNLRCPLSITLLLSAGIIATHSIPVSAGKHTHKKVITTPVARGERIMPSIYDLGDIHIHTLDGSDINLADFKGHPILVVNVASDSWYRDQFKELEELFEIYRDQGLVIIGVYSDDFGHNSDFDPRIQHPTDHNVVEFILTEAVHVTDQPGEYEAHPFFKWILREANKSSVTFGNLHSSFYKFLISKQGKFIDWYAPMTSPKSSKIIKAVQKALAE